MWLYRRRKYGVPSVDILLRVSVIIEPEKFVRIFYQRIIILVYSKNYGLAIEQLKVGEKINEIKMTPKLLRELDITDCVITIDAIGYQKQIVKQIIEQNDHYCLEVKINKAIL